MSSPEYQRAYRHGIKRKVFDHYGGKCACCGETEYMFLTLDHVNNDGAEHRRAMGGRNASPDTLYRQLVKTNFKEEARFQVLCYNCNCSKRGNKGICPHEERK